MDLSHQGFDSGATIFSSLFYDESVAYPFYTGSSDIEWYNGIKLVVRDGSLYILLME